MQRERECVSNLAPSFPRWTNCQRAGVTAESPAPQHLFQALTFFVLPRGFASDPINDARPARNWAASFPRSRPPPLPPLPPSRLRCDDKSPPLTPSAAATQPCEERESEPWDKPWDPGNARGERPREQATRRAPRPGGRVMMTNRDGSHTWGLFRHRNPRPALLSRS